MVVLSQAKILSLQDFVVKRSTMSLFVPQEPIKMDSLNDIESFSPRDFVIQGELLRFFLIVTIPDGSIPCENEEEYKTLLEQIFGTLSLSIFFDDGSGAPSNISSPGNRSTSGPGGGGGILASMIDRSPDHKYYEDSEQIISDNSNSSKKKKKNQNVFKILSKNQVCISLNVAISLKEKYLQRKFNLFAKVSPSIVLPHHSEASSFRMQHATQMQKFPKRYISASLTLLSPIKIKSEYIPCGTSKFISFSLENCHSSLPIFIKDFQVDPQTSITMDDSSTDTNNNISSDGVNYKDRNGNNSCGIDFCLQKSMMPRTISASDCENFVISFQEKNSSLIHKQFHFFAVFFSWKMDCFSGCILSRHDVKVEGNLVKKIMFSYECPASVSLKSTFRPKFSIINMYSNRTLEAEILVVPTEISSQALPIICLQKSFFLGVIKPESTVSFELEFLAIQSGLHQLHEIILLDRKTGAKFVVEDKSQIFVV